MKGNTILKVYDKQLRVKNTIENIVFGFSRYAMLLGMSFILLYPIIYMLSM